MKKVTKKVLFLILAAVMAVSLLAGCNASSSGGASSSGSGSSSSGSSTAIKAKAAKDPSKDPIKIAVIPMSQLGSNNIPVAKAWNEMLSEFPNITVTMMEANYDPTTQIKLINECVTQGYNGIVLEATDAAAISNAVKAAEEAGVVVITNNVDCQAVHTALVQNSDVTAGQSAAKSISKLLNNTGNIVILDGDIAQSTVRFYGAAFDEWIKKNSGVKILTHEHVAKWSNENANTMMRDILTKFDKIDAVWVANDDMAAGAISAIKAANRQGVIVWSYGGTQIGLQAIKDGTMAGCNYADSYAVTVAQIYAEMYCIATGVNSKALGLTKTPVLSVSCPTVTKDNVDLYMSIQRFSK